MNIEAKDNIDEILITQVTYQGENMNNLNIRISISSCSQHDATRAAYLFVFKCF